MALPLRYHGLSLLARPLNTFSAITLIAVIIAVFCYLQAVTDSAFNTMLASGDPNTILVLRQAAETESVSELTKDLINKLELTPNVVKDGTNALISAELVAISSGLSKDNPDIQVNAAVRGVAFDRANKVRHGRVEIIEGRQFTPGTYEVIVGESARRTFHNQNVGDEIEIGTRGIRKFKIVGVFSTSGTSADSEVWGYVETMRDVYDRGGYSSARLLVQNEQQARQAIKYIEGPEVQQTAMTERSYFRNIQTGQQATQILSVIMIVIMGIAAAFAVANTMYAAVAGRTREIGMLRAIGFSSSSILTSFVIEGLLLTFIGGSLGCAFSFICNGMQKHMLPQTFTTISYSLAITPKIVFVSLIVALVIGFLGSIFPAWRAARMRVTLALREQ